MAAAKSGWRQRRAGVLVTLLALIGGAVAWWATRPALQYETTTLARADIEAAVTAVGTLQPRHYVDVGAQVSGQINRLHVQPGTEVRKGQLLVEIDPSVAQATVDAGRAALAALRAQLAEQQAQQRLASQQLTRQQRMAGDGATRDEDVQQAEAAVAGASARIANLRALIEQNQANLKGDEARLGYTRIYAPIAGTVVSLEAREGQTLNATYQTPNILRIADLSHMTVWTEVSEADVRRVKPDMGVYFTTLGSERRRWASKVRQVLPSPPVPESKGGSAPPAAAVGKVVLYTVLFDVANADGELMPQMTTQVTFVTAAARNVVSAPLTALQPQAGQAGRYRGRVLNKEGKIEAREIRIGVRSRLHGEVLDGVSEGERLVTGERMVSNAARRFKL